MLLCQFLILYFIFVDSVKSSSLTPGGAHVCFATFSQPYNVVVTRYRVGYENYRTCCGWDFLGCWDSCTRSRSKVVGYTATEVRYKPAVRYFCCSGWSRQGTVCSTPICNPGCKSGRCVGPNTCVCYSGYNGKFCQKDINECKAGNPCDQTCTNTIGSYYCSCNQGYQKPQISSSTSPECINVNECLTGPCKCTHTLSCKATCVDTVGNFRCSCNVGFQLMFDQRTCQDIDECSLQNLNVCQQQCNNLIGSFKCSCNRGYLLQSDNKSCKDINECDNLNGGCSQTCTNKPATYQCSCKRGFRLSSDSKTCQDVDECKEQKPCDNTNGICKNTIGSYRCSCKSGYQLLPDKKTCKDKNECLVKDSNGCHHKCTNTIGSYVCSCNLGFQLAIDQRTCDDINECYNNPKTCDHICVNTIGSYKCKCRDGHGLEDNQHICTALPCQIITSPLHGNITCSGYVTDESCQYTCAEGFNMIGFKRRTCLPTSQWSGVDPVCQKKICPNIIPPKYGSVRLPCIEEFGVECLIMCSKGYYLEGSEVSKCVLKRNETEWTGNHNQCKEQTACEPNPCLNGGRCVKTGDNSFSCDCLGTLFDGSQCERGRLVVPDFILLFMKSATAAVTIHIKPAFFMRISLQSDKNAVKLYPSQVEVTHPQQFAKFQVHVIREGKYEIVYKLKSFGNFIPPKATEIYVFVDKPSLLIDYGFNSLKEKCGEFALKNLTLVSTCQFSNDGVTFGFVSVKINSNISLPLSMVGIQQKHVTTFGSFVLDVFKEMDSYLQKRIIKECTSCNTAKRISQTARIDYVLQNGLFPMVFFKEFSHLLPIWLRIMALETYNQPHYKQNLLTKILPSAELKFHKCLILFPDEAKDLFFKDQFYIVYEPRLPTVISSVGHIFQITESTRVCYFVNTKGVSFISSSYPLKFIDSRSNKNIISELSSHFVTIDSKSNKHSLFLDIKMNTRTFNGRFHFKTLFQTSDMEKFMMEKFNSIFAAWGNGNVDFDVNLDLMGSKLLVQGIRLHSKQLLTLLGNQKADLQLEVSGFTKFQLGLSAFQFHSKNNTKLLIPLQVYGGQTTGVINRDVLSTKLRYLKRSERESDKVVDELFAIDETLKDIFSKKATTFFKTLSDAYALINNQNDALNYIQMVRSIEEIKYSYFDTLSFVNSLLYEYQQDSNKLRLKSLLLAFIRRFQNAATLEVIPNKSDVTMIDNNGVTIKYNGSLCIYQLCFPDLDHVTITYLVDDDFVSIQANCNPFNASHRLRFSTNDTIIIKVNKYTETLQGTITGAVKFFNKFHPFQMIIDATSYRYNLPVVFPGGLLFNISSSSDLLKATWDDLIAKVQGKTNNVDELNIKMEKVFLDISNFTNARIKLLRERTLETKDKYQQVLEETNTVQGEADNYSIEYQKVQSEYNQLLTNITSERLRYSSFLKSEESLFVIDRDVNKICRTLNCSNVCLPMVTCDICQDKVQIPMKRWKCNNYVEKVKTSQLVKVEQTCEEIKYQFSTRYTRTCAENPNTRRQREQQNKQALSAIGTGIGSFFGPLGSILGGLIGGLISNLFSSCDVSYEVIKHRRVNTWPCTNYTVDIVTTEVPKSSCDLETVIVDGGLSKAKECNCHQDPCKVKATNATCILKNKECRMQRKLALQNRGNTSELYIRLQGLYNSIETTENVLEDLFPKVEEKRLQNNIFQSLLIRKRNSLLIVEQEKQLARQNLDNEQIALGNDMCIRQHYLDYNNKLDYSITDLTFQTLLPLSTNILLSASIQQTSSGTSKSIPFIYELKDYENAKEIAIKKIVYATLCEQTRQRRSIDPFGNTHDMELGFNSWDRRENSTAVEKACFTFNAIVTFFGDVLFDLQHLVEDSIHLENIVKISGAEFQKSGIYKRTSLTNEESTLNQLLTLQIEINQNRSTLFNLMKKWRENSEIYTGENNFTVCLSYEDCVQMAFRTLSSIPMLVQNYQTTYTLMLVSIQNAWKDLERVNQTLSKLELLDNIKKLSSDLIEFNTTNWFCISPPKVGKRVTTEYNISIASVLTIHCGDVQSDLPVKYQWSLHNIPLDGKDRDSITLKASVDKAGVYTCTVASDAGQTSSEGISLNVYEPPKVVLQPEDVTRNLINDDQIPLVILCKVDGYPKPTVSWFFKSFNKSSMAVILLDEIGPELSFNESYRRRDGKYFCEAKNNHGFIRSREANYEVLSTILPNQYIIMHVDLIPQNKTHHEQLQNISFIDFPDNFTEMFNFTDNQNVTFFVNVTDGVFRLFFTATAMYPLNTTTNSSFAELTSTLKRSRESLAISAGKFLRWANSNFTTIQLPGSAVVEADNRSLSYEATLDECKPGFEIHKSGIICVQCKTGFYNVQRQGRCQQCPHEHTTVSKGTTSKIQCIRTNDDKMKGDEVKDAEASYVAVVASGGGLILLLAIFLFVCLCARRRRNTKENEAIVQNQEISNNGFDNDQMESIQEPAVVELPKPVVGSTYKRIQDVHDEAHPSSTKRRNMKTKATNQNVYEEAPYPIDSPNMKGQSDTGNDEHIYETFPEMRNAKRDKAIPANRVLAHQLGFEKTGGERTCDPPASKLTSELEGVMRTMHSFDNPTFDSSE